MMKRALVDTGPLVAILSRQDEHHAACVNALRDLPGPLLSCWPVITEAAWLLRKSPRAVQQLLRSIDGSFLELLPLAGAEAEALAALMKRYEDIRAQLADVALVYLANREKIETIFTLDHRDFSIYRSGRKTTFRIVPETE
ncbi:MAG TPA: PIN domain-containing protein [Candidatus Sulfotelmatobacter sp.]|nr:PIN domain-containing protein [Candidatus Sulfotelmatobacter sp.]